MGETLNKTRALGVLAGRDLPLDALLAWARSADFVVAADGAANTLYEGEFVPDLVVGDLDSIAESTYCVQVEVIRIEDQNQTDCDKLLGLISESGYDSVTLCGLEGDALDHVLASLQSAAKSNLSVRLVTRKGLGWVLRGGEAKVMSLPIGARLSLIPLSDCSEVELLGVEWELRSTLISPLGATSISNRVVGDVKVSLGTGACALFVSDPSLLTPSWEI